MSRTRRTRHDTPRAAAPRARVRIASDPRAGESGMLAPSADGAAALRAARERARRRRIAQRNRDYGYFAAAVVVMVVLMIGWTFSREQQPSTTLADEAAANMPTSPEVGVTAANRTDPTPLFASYRSLHLYLPVPCTKLSEIAFHQASRDNALHMESLLPDADMTAAFNNKGTGRDADDANDEAGPDVLTGSVLRMWRSNRTGPPDTAVDVGATAGTPVYAPVTGTVVEVRPYKLYGEHDDYEVHIQPNGWPEVDVVLIHIDDVCVQAGDEVIGGYTQVATVRRLSDRVIPQISAYSSDDGDHVHLQLNAVDVPGKLESVDGS